MTVEKFINKIKDPKLRRATMIYVLGKGREKVPQSSFHKAIVAGFFWGETLEELLIGHRFWPTMYEHTKKPNTKELLVLCKIRHAHKNYIEQLEKTMEIYTKGLNRYETERRH